MEKLEDVRAEIDAIDDALLPLLIRRMDAAKRVAQIKRAAGTPVLNAAREEEILRAVAQRGGPYGDGLKILYSTMMDVSRALQHQLLGGGGDLRAQIADAIAHGTGAIRRPAVACAGIEGSYAGEAARLLFPETAPQYHAAFEEVFASVADGRADYGVIPIENSYAGSVHENFDLMLKYRLYIADAIDLPVRHCLLANPGVGEGEIRKVYSHPQGLAQCAEFLERHGYEAVSCSNTAVAAQKIAQSGARDCAAIASEEAARLFSLQVVRHGIQASSRNETRFIVLSRLLEIRENADKISLIFNLPHTTGSLYRTLARFALCGLNLTKIESRPVKGRNFHYYFYLDFTGSVRDPQVVDLLCALHDELPDFNFLGNFPERARPSV